MARTDDLALAIWALHVAIWKRPVPPELIATQRAISIAARTLFPKQWNAYRMLGYYGRMNAGQRAHRIAEQGKYNKRWRDLNPDKDRAIWTRAQSVYRERHRKLLAQREAEKVASGYYRTDEYRARHRAARAKARQA